MAHHPQYNFNSPIDDEEYRLRAEAKARRRKKRQRQRLALLGAFALAAILLLVAIIMFFRSIFGKDSKNKAPSVPSSSSSLSEPAPQYAHPVAADPNVWNLKLVNAHFPLPEDFTIPGEQLASIAQGSVPYWFDTRIVDQLKQMIADCNANVENGSLAIISGYRSPKTQNGRYAHLVEVLKGQGHTDAEADVLARQIDPPAGLSEHQLGLAVDFVTGTVTEPSSEFASTPEFQWLIQNAANYGFILRYPSEKENITGIKAQPYQFRFVGVDEAKAISGSGICLEEYLMTLPQPTEDPPAETQSTPLGEDGNQATSA